MALDENLQKTLLENSESARVQAKKYLEKRHGFSSVFGKGRAFIGIAGLRGIGKTTMLKQRLLQEPDAFYISLDSFTNLNLFETAKAIQERYGVKELLLDEISYSKNWQDQLKQIYDGLEIRVFFTSSVAIDIINAGADLSRRVIVKNLFPFSFREYLHFAKKIDVGRIGIGHLGDAKKMQEIARLDPYFEEYAAGGIVPAYMEDKNPAIFRGILERIIERDLVFSLGFDGKDILNVKAMLEHIANSTVEDVSYSSISRNIGITKYKAIRYVEAMEKAFVLNPVKPAGSNVMKEPKILFTPPFRALFQKNMEVGKSVGTLREEFFVEAMKINGFPVQYLKGARGEKKPNYTTTMHGKKYVFEIGGPTKNRAQMKAMGKNSCILTYPSNTTPPYKPLTAIGLL